ncbi:hypothetical protein BDK51DRAFT_44598 [Blyttiomyces helicus]|uniref:Uncharacterized protein n=1 Tax=Blyttiomyces helicus TaxID=388810 RepID=A0A4P9W0P1_9FUNG|nr:hypothetical protein BDK51DRAFT_44598 [Blyttiomyces helicus]|eukprot:RKO84120.1 hypothetical protein BDK51DRAFT_44598 [Blyttiomyces helicus]
MDFHPGDSKLRPTRRRLVRDATAQTHFDEMEASRVFGMETFAQTVGGENQRNAGDDAFGRRTFSTAPSMSGRQVFQNARAGLLFFEVFVAIVPPHVHPSRAVPPPFATKRGLTSSAQKLVCALGKGKVKTSRRSSTYYIYTTLISRIVEQQLLFWNSNDRAPSAVSLRHGYPGQNLGSERVGGLIIDINPIGVARPERTERTQSHRAIALERAI